jgi:guanylate kinase
VGRLVVLSGPSGVGKGTVIAGLRARRPDLALSVSATTRPRRPHEVDGVHYHFLDDDAFSALVAADGFLEWAEYAGARYGTPAAPVERLLAEGTDVLLEIEVQGARQVRERRPDALLVLLVPPSLADLEQRLRGRGTEDPESLARRLAAARSELDQARLFDRVVVNDRVPDAVEELDRILAQPIAR